MLYSVASQSNESSMERHTDIILHQRDGVKAEDLTDPAKRVVIEGECL
ncbi:hypothetical protein SAMN05444359_104189 [Neolewinella agarilytica]|uniref:Uncharacterized protein n=1 Tax=Neolewinella agarilytica TaxID=478744 RepID=A0A1H9CGB2_9BACT|nr:hypothetical protein SAMN05444359_104189 [Neolewinella agarilytica]